MSLPPSCRPARLTLAALVLVLAAALAPSPAAARNCGSAIACACGDTVTTTTTLSGDLGPCTGNGLYVKSGVTLDCAGHSVTGSNLPGAWYGISLDLATAGTVRNCRVTAFRRGIRIRGGSDNVVENNEVVLNKYGIDVAGAAKASRITGNLIHDHRDEGIHIGTDADGTVVLDNDIWNTKREHVYVLDADDCRIEGNLLHASRKAAIYLKNSHRTQVTANVVSDRAIQVRGNSTHNVFTDNDLRGNGYIVDAQLQLDGTWLHPHDNTFSGGSIQNTGYCFRFYGSYDNTATEIATDGKCVPITEVARGGVVPHGNTVEVVPLP